MINIIYILLFTIPLKNCPEMFCSSCGLYNDLYVCNKCFDSAYNPIIKRCVSLE